MIRLFFFHTFTQTYSHTLRLKLVSQFNQLSAGEVASNFLCTMPVISKIHPDLQEARDKVTFKLEEFTNWFYGGVDKVKEKRFLGNF